MAQGLQSLQQKIVSADIKTKRVLILKGSHPSLAPREAMDKYTLHHVGLTQHIQTKYDKSFLF